MDASSPGGRLQVLAHLRARLPTTGTLPAGAAGEAAAVLDSHLLLAEAAVGAPAAVDTFVEHLVGLSASQQARALASSTQPPADASCCYRTRAAGLRHCSSQSPSVQALCAVLLHVSRPWVPASCCS